MNKKIHTPIFVTGAERSGSTLIARILSMCGVWTGSCNTMFENRAVVDLNNELLHGHEMGMPQTLSLQIPVNWKNAIDGVHLAQGGNDTPWMIKHSTLARLWPVYDYAYPDAKWVIVRRRTGDIVSSCVLTGYMKLFKDPNILLKFGYKDEREGWLWWVHEYENRFVEMIQSGVNCKIIWPERMVTGNYEQIYEMVEWLGLRWNNDIPKVIDPLLNKSREVMYENND